MDRIERVFNDSSSDSDDPEISELQFIGDQLFHEDKNSIPKLT